MAYDESRLQYLTDANGNPTAVLVPLDVWEAIQEEQERDDTTYLTSNPVMMARLREARASQEGINSDELFAKLDKEGELKGQS